MKITVRFFLSTFFYSVLCIFCIYAQDASSTNEINQNIFESKNGLNLIIKLNAEVDGDIVTLNWEPVPGEITILSSKIPITTSNWNSANHIAVVSGTQKSWSAQIEQGKSYYYAIIAKKQQIDDTQNFTPLENATLLPIYIEGDRQTQLSHFTSFDVVTRNDAVILTWKSDLSGNNLVLYRSTSPFISLESLVQSIPVSSFQDSGVPFVDYPVPGIPYYYAILDEGTIRTGTVSFEYGINTNRIPVEIPSYFAKIQRNPLPAIRPMPLPWLNPYKEIKPLPAIFSIETNKIITNLLEKKPIQKTPEREAFIFSIDIKPVGGGEELALKKIIETHFITAQWETAAKEIGNFLSIRRTPETVARARFYLGQTYFFRGDYTNALLEFLLSQDEYYNKSREWIQYSMERLNN